MTFDSSAPTLVSRLSAATKSDALQFMLRFFTHLDFRTPAACNSRTNPDTTVGSAATEASTSSSTQNTLTKTPPPHSQTHPIFHELLTEMAKKGGGVITSTALTAALKKRDKAATTGSAILALHEVVDDTLTAIRESPGYKLTRCLQKCANTDCFGPHWAMLLNAPETLRHPGTWLRAADKALSYTNDSLATTMTKVLGSSVTAHSFSEHPISAWLLLETICEQRRQATPDLLILHENINTIMTTATAKSQPDANARFDALTVAGNDCRRLLERHTDLSAVDLITILEALAKARISELQGLGKFLKDKTLDEAAHSKAFLTAATTFSSRSRVLLPKQPQHRRQQRTPPRRSTQLTPAHISYLKALYPLLDTGPNWETLSRAHDDAVAAHMPADVNPNLRAFIQDTGNFKKYFPRKYQAKARALMPPQDA